MLETSISGITDEEYLRHILDRLDQREAMDQGTGRRKARRFSYRVPDVRVRLLPPSGGAIDTIVQTVDLSSGGLGFLYRGFLYNGTEVHLKLNQRGGSVDDVVGDVVRCQHAGGTYHIVGVKFRVPLYPRLFVDTGADDDTAGGPGSTLDVRGHVLFIDTQELDRLLFQYHTSGTPLKVEYANSVDATMEAVRKHVFDAIILELNLSDCTGEELIRLLRLRKVHCPIVVLTAENSTARLNDARRAGATALIAKPYEPDHLLSTLKHLLDRVRDPSLDEAIFSTLQPAPGVDQLVTQFVEKVRRISTMLEQYMQGMDFPKVRELCLTLKANGTGFGFGALTDGAKTAVTALDASMSVEEAGAELTRLLGICRRLSIGKAPTPAPTAA